MVYAIPLFTFRFKNDLKHPKGKVNMKDEIAKLKLWLAIGDNSQVKLAYMLGYRSSIVIDNWIAKKEIPHHRVNQVMEIIESELSVAGKKRQNQKASSSVGVRP